MVIDIDFPSRCAHDAYLHRRYLRFTWQYEMSADYFRKATELQPDYASRRPRYS